ncbi:hypothetical protein CSC17_0213 [Klebsiella oxytoca]|nr:hypothetical protein CSC17_0213 [Klebsiella oxytoca]
MTFNVSKLTPRIRYFFKVSFLIRYYFRMLLTAVSLYTQNLEVTNNICHTINKKIKEIISRH